MLSCGGPKGEAKSLRSICMKTGVGLRANFRRICKRGYTKNEKYSVAQVIYKR